MDDDAVLAKIRERVDVGAPIDEVLGRSGKNLDSATVVSIRGRKRRRVYTWGTPACEEAFRHGWIERQRVPRPASPDQLRRAEQVISAPFPRLLARILTEVGNGGMGPGNGLLGLGERGHKTDLEQDGLAIAQQVADGTWGKAPEGALPLCHWGCAIMSFVTPDGQVWGWDPNPIEPDQEVPFIVEDYRLTDWLQSWLDGSLLQPWAVKDGDLWRGASPAEKRGANLEEGY